MEPAAVVIRDGEDLNWKAFWDLAHYIVNVPAASYRPIAIQFTVKRRATAAIGEIASNVKWIMNATAKAHGTEKYVFVSRNAESIVIKNLIDESDREICVFPDNSRRVRGN